MRMTERITANGGTLTTNTPQETTPAAEEQRLRLIREEISRLVRDLPGPLTAVTAKIGDSQLEIVWAPPQAAASREIVWTEAAAPAAPAAPPVEETAKAVTAPLVGTFYRAPEPGSRPFVEVGDRIGAGQTIGIVEAMKLMNHVVSDWAGVVTEILADDATAVEFGQPLIRVEPDES
ncbi:acetyl-CoA carboxylase biotin carboxyl carrier protein [Streptosporangium sp. NPDC051023]|uniref:acetyl-CoA carboxylase biotin carboxyl carrier protein n=1 Tax=Streptosporangium sp. NPDC051023 TaxID=3155410 RepID=UPI003450D53E